MGSHVLARSQVLEPGFGILVDLRALEMPDPDPEHVVAVGRNLVSLRDQLRGRVAVIVPEGLSTAAELSVAIAGAEGFSALVFTDPEEGLAWVLEGPAPGESQPPAPDPA